MIDLLTLVLFFCGLGLYILWNKTARNAKLPPGPPTTPFLGNLNTKLDNLLEDFRLYRLKYGDVFSLILGSKTMVVVNGLETLKDVFIKNGDVTSDRPDSFIVKDIGHFKGIGSSSGSLWKEHRTFTIGALREFGFGKRSQESKIKEEIEVLIRVIGEQNGTPFKIKGLLTLCVSNIMCSIIFGKRYEHTDKFFMSLLEKINENMSNGNALMKSEKGNTESTFDYEQLLKTILDLFTAGTETTSTAVQWFIVLLVNHPEVQNLMRREINDVIGTSRYPCMEERQKLPYTDAVLHEVLRFGCIGPLALPHGLTQDLNYKGYVIPKDSMLIPNLHSVLYDPEVFEDPETFRPTRFLDAERKLVNVDKVLTFSLGRRVCPGESLARMEFFLFTTSLVQRFKLLPSDPNHLPSLKGKLGITVRKSYLTKAIRGTPLVAFEGVEY
ncbi:Cytochrome P450 2C20,Cytochrome P450 2D15,Cytochrome P450 2E1,Cytochrome P450 2J3,Cytochrome P450 2M1,Cytochrome P450 2G1,Cytochrome P450 2A13,Vitamin D(3) 25-hydroxylase,Cytochrome P450 2F3,Cytochrome P450 2K3,Cytochrome P450 2C55,Cytochrome P450 2F2,Cytochrome P450 2C2,Cytochrome P450 2A11,Vitamin D 25-hydroxylase,Cytochrome P450 2J1,Cytochrome P450 2L1,Cytochrome P450 2C8,Cytochrome P450 2A10,Cytochrome P450 2K1,Cytochrome P450 2C31,Cytochrome P450 2K4,Cytochrome P450 2B12,Cytochrome P450 2J2,Cytochrome|uniref:Uncharacterized protein n=1 Tax=Mytilus coruscus TaxID=42192 RepID=A0A6J8E2U5_MYTCO|nr:Cytochrome P450 2C20,Cytochrome P450 2D15,Cytochrome P450 2E1,Cytochrome P450 2J3,Cytochrome P450 2M1,Cytochrome P450 2G1,Cytochrome P450 2A13,Vitamin D(3) 25-hydroxylase,Cytochrome P450 2F3,Cytochrome P450 2K3,Cytochrome P450 2C55,Cytochrome P450 2F2,Cytochrome P450 2C2,Cytochrome P450 2A11,Vitamin D 25-hydroxylase,Cytochrome P450 2J1,Cytochrome P450 2L1,Cytochrome P450 2C8,Cytochrome P450 2A10,Cytochrome P450 2K1,Cytochrome P450 2C31,Cytochrome P450 2K4,Cytochrome P450 2B12,Cytochrome P450 2J2